MERIVLWIRNISYIKGGVCRPPSFDTPYWCL